jgi:hypothetical protein
MKRKSAHDTRASRSGMLIRAVAGIWRKGMMPVTLAKRMKKNSPVR